MAIYYIDIQDGGSHSEALDNIRGKISEQWGYVNSGMNKRVIALFGPDDASKEEVADLKGYLEEQPYFDGFRKENETRSIDFYEGQYFERVGTHGPDVK